MKIGVLSDTHIPYTTRTLPQNVLDLLSKMDAIIHAGDFQDPSVIETLRSLADFYGVYGNMDPLEIRNILPEKRVVSLAGFSIGITHGWGSPNRLEDRILTSFVGEKLDAIVYGHSHRASNNKKGHILFFNPGTPTDTRFAKNTSIGILTLDKFINGEIIKL
jgi:putative phosphoesterase